MHVFRNGLKRLRFRWRCMKWDVHPRDPFFTEDHKHYFDVGRECLRNLERGLALAGRELADVQRLLEFASGHGRLIRHLVRIVPPERVWACEIDPEALDFTRERFGVHGILSQLVPDRVDLGDSYEAINATSIFTHLPKRLWIPWLQKLAQHLSPGGIFVFTAQGAHSVQRAGELYNITETALARLRADFGNTGFGYAEYPRDPSGRDASSYGTTVTSREFVERELREAGLTTIDFQALGLDKHQDVYVAARPSRVSGDQLRRG